MNECNVTRTENKNKNKKMEEWAKEREKVEKMLEVLRLNFNAMFSNYFNRYRYRISIYARRISVNYHEMKESMIVTL